MTAAAGKGGAGRTLISGKHIKAAAIQVKIDPYLLKQDSVLLFVSPYKLHPTEIKLESEQVR